MASRTRDVKKLKPPLTAFRQVWRLSGFLRSQGRGQYRGHRRWQPLRSLPPRRSVRAAPAKMNAPGDVSFGAFRTRGGCDAFYGLFWSEAQGLIYELDH